MEFYHRLDYYDFPQRRLRDKQRRKRKGERWHTKHAHWELYILCNFFTRCREPESCPWSGFFYSDDDLLSSRTCQNSYCEQNITYHCHYVCFLLLLPVLGRKMWYFLWFSRNSSRTLKFFSHCRKQCFVSSKLRAQNLTFCDLNAIYRDLILKRIYALV